MRTSMCMLVAMIYVYFVLNHTYNVTIKKIPMNTGTCSTCDISPFLCFHFWKPFYFNSDDSNFPSDSIEEIELFEGISENIGHKMNIYNLNITTHKVISRSNVIPAGEPTSPNFRIDPLTAPEIVKYRHLPFDYVEDYEATPADTEKESPGASASSPKYSMLILNPKGLTGSAFLIPQDDVQRLRARIVKSIDDYEGDLQRDSSIMKFIFSTKDDAVEDFFTYN